MLTSKLNILILLTLFYLGANGAEQVDKGEKYLTYKINQMKQHFERSLNQMKNEIKDIKGKSANHTCDEGWTPYKDEKCYKIVERKGTEADAKAQCLKLDDSSTLPTIQSENEMSFLSNLLIRHNNISAHAWIGLQPNLEDDFKEGAQDIRQNSFVSEDEQNEPKIQRKQTMAYKWVDDSPLNYQHWDEEADRSKDCVKMSLTRSSSGRWTDDSCTKKSLIVCQIKQWTPTVMGQELQSMKKLVNSMKTGFERQTNDLKTNIEKQQKEINSLIPIGFLYTQLPYTSAPTLLWPQFKWSDVTRDYSGLFFRAEGGEALPFGQIQPQNQSWISNFHLYGGHYDSWNSKGDWSGGHYEEYTTSLNQGQWIETNPGNNLAIGSLVFYTTSGEVRPKNTAIRIFKRIE